MQASMTSLCPSRWSTQRAAKRMARVYSGPVARLGHAGLAPGRLQSLGLQALSLRLLTSGGKSAATRVVIARASDKGCDEQSTWQDKLKMALDSVQAPGKFATSAAYTKDLPATPLITVQGVGPLSLPLSIRQAAALLSAGEPAPYGKGMDTAHDEAVRRATQLAPDLVTPSAAWTEALSSITRAAANKLGVDPDCPVEAHLYKVLVYEPGGHFVVHRDTEKEPGMFGTLVVQLPVQGGHTGGSLEMTGPTGMKHVWRSANGSSRSLQYCAFYADMEHQLMPVRCGLRVVLTYNLVRPGQGPRPEPSRCFSDAALEQVIAAVKEWEELSGAAVTSEGANKQPSLRAVALEHRYTKKNLSVGNLKGRDSALVGLLQSCPALDVKLALVTKSLTEWDPQRVEMEEDYFTRWVPPETNYPQPRALDYEFDFLGEPLFAEHEDDKNRLLKADEEEYGPYTGNEGPTVEYLYHRAAVAFWPRAQYVKVVDGLDDMLRLIAKRLQAGDCRQAVSDMAVMMELVENEECKPFRDEYGYVRIPIYDDQATYTFKLVCQLADLATTASEKSEAVRMGAQLTRILMMPYGILSAKVAEVLAEAAAKVNSDVFDVSIEALVQAWGPKQLGGCMWLVSSCRASESRQKRFWIALMAALGIHQQGGQLPAAYSVDDAVALARILLAGAEGVPTTLPDTHIESFVEAVLAHPNSQAFLRSLLKDQVVRAAARDPRVARLVKARVKELEARTSGGPAGQGRLTAGGPRTATPKTTRQYELQVKELADVRSLL